MKTTGGGQVIGEEALRRFLVDLALTMSKSDTSNDSLEGLIGWDLLGDQKWWDDLLADVN